jgi:hypothetical protein
MQFGSIKPPPGSGSSAGFAAEKMLQSEHDRAKDPTGGATYHGFVPDTDPRYSSGWNYLSPKNLRPKPPERERAEQSKDQEKPE